MDACIFVIVRFAKFKDRHDTHHWALWVGFTHVSFPLFGFILGFVLVTQAELAVIVYSVGALLLALLIWFIVVEASNRFKVKLSKFAPRLAKLLAFAPLAGYQTWLQSRYPFAVAVLAVSIDAFLAGPGKAVMVERYPEYMVIASFVIVGALVYSLVWGAGEVALALRAIWDDERKKFFSPEELAGTATLGYSLAICFFSFFMVWSMVKAIEHAGLVGHAEFSLARIAMTGAGVGAAICLVTARSIYRYQKPRTKYIINTKSA